MCTGVLDRLFLTLPDLILKSNSQGGHSVRVVILYVEWIAFMKKTFILIPEGVIILCELFFASIPDRAGNEQNFD
jgi:hypothetical protein